MSLAHVSIAMTTFNGEKFLQQQLDSLAALEPTPAELVICDDRSTDMTVSIVETFSKIAPFPVVLKINKINLGWRANFFEAALLCRQELIAFCDQDDVWYPGKLCRVVELFSKQDLLLVHHEADLIDGSGSVLGKLRINERDRETLPALSKPTIWSHAPGLTIVFRRSLLVFSQYWSDSIDPGNPDMPAAHDQWIYHLASNLGEVRFLNEALVGYRQHDANQVGFRKTRYHTFSSPSELKDEIAIHVRMLSGFSSALEKALAHGGTGFEAQLPAAIEANRTLESRLRIRSELYHEPDAIRRLTLFCSLLKSRSYSRSTKWNLGRRSLLADLRAVLSQPD